MTTEQQKALVERHVAALAEHFEAVQILVSTHGGEATDYVFRGGGNAFARRGMAQVFLEQDVASINAAEIASALDPPPDEGEEWKKAP